MGSDAPPVAIDGAEGPAVHPPEIRALDIAVAPVRARFRPLIAEAASWALARGIRFPPDGLALILAAAEHPGDLLAPWTRPRVNHLIMCDVFNWCSLHRVLVPAEVPELIWAFLDFLAASQRLAPGSDPLGRLREPLMCYGGLDTDGRRRPRDQPAPFPCECYLEVVPTDDPECSRWRTNGGFVLAMRRPAPDEPELAGWWHPLVRFARRAREQGVPWPVYVDEFRFVGRIVRKNRPELWVYFHVRSKAELFVDSDGQAYRLCPDKRTKVGARFLACDERRAIFAAGMPSVVDAVWYDPPTRWSGGYDSTDGWGEWDAQATDGAEELGGVGQARTWRALHAVVDTTAT